MLTRKQQNTLEFIRSFMATNQQAPTDEEIATGIGIKSRGVAHRYVVAIEKAGFIKRLPGRKRNIRLRHNYKNQVLGLPLMGRLIKDQPIKTIDEKDLFNLNTQLLKPNRFILQIGDDTLKSCGIFKDDYIVCELERKANNNDIIIAIINEQTAQLKTYQQENDDTVILSDPFQKTNPMRFNKDSIKIHGVYKALFRFSDDKA